MINLCYYAFDKQSINFDKKGDVYFSGRVFFWFHFFMFRSYLAFTTWMLFSVPFLCFSMKRDRHMFCAFRNNPYQLGRKLVEIWSFLHSALFNFVVKFFKYKDLPYPDKTSYELFIVPYLLSFVNFWQVQRWSSQCVGRFNC